MQNGFGFEHPETEIVKTIIVEEQNSQNTPEEKKAIIRIKKFM